MIEFELQIVKDIDLVKSTLSIFGDVFIIPVDKVLKI